MEVHIVLIFGFWTAVLTGIGFLLIPFALVVRYMLMLCAVQRGLNRGTLTRYESNAAFAVDSISSLMSEDWRYPVNSLVWMSIPSIVFACIGVTIDSLI